MPVLVSNFRTNMLFLSTTHQIKTHFDAHFYPFIKSKDKCIQVQDDSIAMQTKENRELKIAIEQIGTKLAYARRPASRKFVGLLSFPFEDKV